MSDNAFRGKCFPGGLTLRPSSSSVRPTEVQATTGVVEDTATGKFLPYFLFKAWLAKTQPNPSNWTEGGAKPAAPAFLNQDFVWIQKKQASSDSVYKATQDIASRTLSDEVRPTCIKIHWNLLHVERWYK